MLNRFANIFWHYYSGPLLGFKQQFWPQEKQYSVAARIVSVCLYLAQLAVLVFVSMPVAPRLGLALILFSPQWMYVYAIPHPVFEFRGYGMAAGAALILVWLLVAYPVVVISLSLVWAGRSLVRRKILTKPLLFWKRTQEEHNGS